MFPLLRQFLGFVVSVFNHLDVPTKIQAETIADLLTFDLSSGFTPIITASAH